MFETLYTVLYYNQQKSSAIPFDMFMWIIKGKNNQTTLHTRTRDQEEEYDDSHPCYDKGWNNGGLLYLATRDS